MKSDHFQEIFEKAALGIVVADENLCFTEVNRSVEELFGYAPGEMIGMPISQITAPGFMDENLSNFEELKAGKRNSYQMIKRYIRKDGDIVWGKITASLLERDGEKLRILGIFEDITAQKLMEENLRKSEERFRQILTSMYDWVWEVNAQAIYTFVSPNVRDILGYEPEEILGKTPFDLMPPEEAERVGEIFGEIVQRKAPFKYLENINRHKNGHEMLLETSGVPILSAEGELQGYRGVDRDITQRKQMKEELAQSRKLQAVGQLTGGIAHDFNNILHVMIGNLHLIREDAGSDGEISELADSAIEIGQRGSHLIRQLLSFSGRQELQPNWRQVNDLVRPFIPLLEHTLGSNIKITSNLQDDLREIYVDPDSLQIAVLNLAINSRDAMLGGGEITISTYSEISPTSLDVVAINLSDNGCGMSDEIREKVFEPFYTTKDVGKGSGMGLSMVYGFMKQSMGSVEIKSVEGKGTTVRLIFPVGPHEV